MTRAAHGDVVKRFFRALERASPSANGVVAVQVRLPQREAGAFWLGGAPLVAYGRAEEERVRGFGIARKIVLPKFDAAAVKRWAAKTLEGLAFDVGPAPRVFGGAAFSETSARTAPWDNFGALQFRLPRWVHVAGATGTWLQFYSDTRAITPSDRRLAARELQYLLTTVERPPRAATFVMPQQLSPQRWRVLIEKALETIARRQIQKVVVARAAELRGRDHWDARALLARLGEAPGSTAFAFGDGAHLFAGATPELLVRRSGRRVETEALAGTAPLEHRAALERSAKDLAEHRFVVDEITRRLRRHCSTVKSPKRPRRRPLRDVQHLLTPIRGRLQRPTHVLDLALTLHPTPAVGGLPRAPAVAWIERHEPTPRGWYAGFIGWFDAQGDGEFSVAIRSGLIHGRTARIYTGAGIVAQSQPDAEYGETAIKQRPFLRALGALR